MVDTLSTIASLRVPQKLSRSPHATVIFYQKTPLALVPMLLVLLSKCLLRKTQQPKIIQNIIICFSVLSKFLSSSEKQRLIFSRVAKHHCITSLRVSKKLSRSPHATVIFYQKTLLALVPILLELHSKCLKGKHNS